ncbi:MAG: Re/Si-specific NAD(P)(+) transhydrogenase subunit alpha [Planctomycetota bacterium]
MTLGVLRETHPGECRVAATPESLKKLLKMGFQVNIESGAGDKASYPDALYAQAGARVLSRAQVLAGSALFLRVRPPQPSEIDELPEGSRLIGFLWPAQNKALLDRLAARRITVLAMDCVPRISRAQKMDALSSMANIAGYRAVVEAANQFGRFFTGQMTAAGKVPPAKVLVIGAGVAGLAAIGAARGLGAIVRAFDTRPAVRDQVKSLGAEFLEVKIQEDGSGSGGYAKEMSPEFIKAEMELFAKQAKEVDIIITTALIPGKKAPVLVVKDTVELMREGSVIVDMAAENGGNCELTRADQVVEHHGVKILGITDLPSRMAAVASQLYANNIGHLLEDMGGAAFTIDHANEVTRGALVLEEGRLMWPAPPKPAPDAPKATPVAAAAPKAPEKPKAYRTGPVLGLGLGLLGLFLIGMFGDSGFLSHFTVFVLSCFVGWQVVWSVTPALHTPLMSVTNAISGIIVVGGLLELAVASKSASIMGVFAVLVATINIVGGFMVTARMLKMFQKGSPGGGKK